MICITHIDDKPFLGRLSVNIDVYVEQNKLIYSEDEIKNNPKEKKRKKAQVLRNNYFVYDFKVQLKLSGTAIGTKYIPRYNCIYMNKYEKFLSVQIDKSLIWFMYIDKIS